MSATLGPRLPAAAAALALVAGLFAIASVDQPLGGNDRSRWLTVRALTEHGTFEVGRRLHAPRGYRDEGLVTEPGWRSEDVVLDPERDLFYSSKPPLLSVFVAALARPLAAVTGWSFEPDAERLVPALLLVVNGLSWAILLAALLALARDLSLGWRARLYLVLALVLGTPVLAYLRVLTNHVPAMAAAAVTAWAVHRALQAPVARPASFALAGGAAGLCAALELPAGALVVVSAVLLARVSPRTLLLVFLPAAALPLSLFVLTNVAGTGSVLPFYFRPETWYRFAGSYWQQPSVVDQGRHGPVAYALQLLVGKHGVLSLSPVLALAWLGSLRAFDPPEDEAARARLRRAKAVAAAVAFLVVILLAGKGTDAPRLALAPLLAAGAAAFALVAARVGQSTPTAAMALVSFAVFVPVVSFYAGDTSNFGGSTVWPRWFLWLVPLWLGALAPVLEEQLASRRGRVVALALLALSVGSTWLAGLEPWRLPWLVRALP